MHRPDDFKSRHSQFSTCKRVGPKCNVAPVFIILRVPRLPLGGSLGTGKRGTVPNSWRAVPIFLTRVNGISVLNFEIKKDNVDFMFFKERQFSLRSQKYGFTKVFATTSKKTYECFEELLNLRKSVKYRKTFTAALKILLRFRSPVWRWIWRQDGLST